MPTWHFWKHSSEISTTIPEKKNLQNGIYDMSRVPFKNCLSKNHTLFLAETIVFFSITALATWSKQFWDNALRDMELS